MKPDGAALHVHQPRAKVLYRCMDNASQAKKSPREAGNIILEAM